MAKPTFYHQRKASMAFHIDHVFLPEAWSPGISVSVGTYEDWVATKRSDHVPITVDITLPNA